MHPIENAKDVLVPRKLDAKIKPFHPLIAEVDTYNMIDVAHEFLNQ